MKRRAFLAFTGSGALGLGLTSLGRPQTVVGAPADAATTGELRLAGLSLVELRRQLYDQLFQVLLPFWDKHGIDHDYGGLMCSLDYDGALVDTGKNLWFLGRAIWVYSFLYQRFGNNRQFLDIAKRTKEFVFKYARQKDGWWAEELSREGKVLRPFSGDTEGMYHLAEGLQEYASASGDDSARETASSILIKLFQNFDSPAFRYRGADFPYLWQSTRAVRPQGLWFLNLRIATQMLRRWSDPKIAAIADRAVDAIVNQHYNTEIGLNTEMLYYDFTRPKEEAQKSRFGHSVEALWMVMDEADRRHHEALWKTCAQRIRHHLDVGWDYVYGGLSQWINVDHPDYQWPVEIPPGTHQQWHFTGEYEYMKCLWCQNEVLIATLNVLERTSAPWAAEYYGMAYQLINEKFWQQQRGYPAGYMLFAGRQMTSQPHVGRQDNYHPLRQLMLNILTLDRMIARKTPLRPSAGALH
jgi:mannose/cellobiose epimerase-like protein (N-acyl-D-glucosamine 2-epimerase family)